MPDGEKRLHQGQPGRSERSQRPAGSAPSVAHRRRPGFTVVPTRKVWTQYGWCDFEVAQVLAEQGVDTELIPTDEGWFTDDEG